MLDRDYPDRARFSRLARQLMVPLAFGMLPPAPSLKTTFLLRQWQRAVAGGASWPEYRSEGLRRHDDFAFLRWLLGPPERTALVLDEARHGATAALAELSRRARRARRPVVSCHLTRRAALVRRPPAVGLLRPDCPTAAPRTARHRLPARHCRPPRQPRRSSFSRDWVAARAMNLNVRAHSEPIRGEDRVRRRPRSLRAAPPAPGRFASPFPACQADSRTSAGCA
jgi:hypothetical protein